LQFEEIATGDKPSVSCYIESDWMFADRREEVIPRLRPGISIEPVMITVFFTARQLIALDVLPKGQRYDQEYFVQKILLSLLHDRKRV
jgi:hypothetical protein